MIALESAVLLPLLAAGETVMVRLPREACASVYCAVTAPVEAARWRLARRIVQVCRRWACATAFWARRAAAGEVPVGSEAAMALARGVLIAVWMASRAAWWGKMVVGGAVAEGLDVHGCRESWEMGVARADSGQVLWMLKSLDSSLA